MAKKSELSLYKLTEYYSQRILHRRVWTLSAYVINTTLGVVVGLTENAGQENDGRTL